MARPKILVVDDYENLRKLVAHFLVRLDYTVLQAADGRSPIKIAIAEAPNFILLDLRSASYERHGSRPSTS